MQNKNQKTNKQVRRAHERIGAIILIVGTLISIAAISSEARRVLGGLAMRPAMAIIEHNGKENETARHPVRFDEVFRATPISGI